MAARRWARMPPRKSGRRSVRVGGGQRGRPGVHEGGHRGGLGGGDARGQQSSDDTGQDVPGSGGGGPGLPGGVQVVTAASRLARRTGDHGDVALQQHGRAEGVGQRAGAPTRSAPTSAPASRWYSPRAGSAPSARTG